MTSFRPAVLLPLPRATDLAAVTRPVVGTPPLVRAVRGLLGARLLRQSEVMICCAEGFGDVVRRCLDAHELPDVEVLVDAEGDRRSCLATGVTYLEGSDVSHVLVHDHRHVMTPAVVTDRVLTALRSGADGVLPVLAMTDSVKAVDGDDVVLGTLDRSRLLSVQYPRGFALAALASRQLDATSVLDADGWSSTDWPDVTTVEGHAEGQRFEIPDDVALLEAVITPTD